MSSNTQLGKAVRDACSELDTLATLVRPAGHLWGGGGALAERAACAAWKARVASLHLQEEGVLAEAEQLLKKAGWKGSLFDGGKSSGGGAESQ